MTDKVSEEAIMKETEETTATESAGNEPEKESGKQEAQTDDQIDFSDLLPPNMDEMLKLTILQLGHWAHIYMGFAMNPREKKITVELPQAKLAIDSTSALVEILLPRLTEKEQRDYKVMVSDLKMNYISKSAGSQQ